MKKITILLCFIALFSNKIFPQCTNPDFSSDNFSGGWTGSTGEYSSGGDNYTVQVNSITQGTDNALPYTAGQQTIMKTSATDPNTNGGLNVIPPTGGNSCRLGNAQYEDCDNGSYPQAARLNYKFTVSSSNDLFTYRYAVVLQQAGHGAGTNPKFTINVLNSTGTQIGGACGTYQAIAKPGLPGYTECLPTASGGGSCDNGDSVLWCNWKTNSLDLSGYVGQSVSIEFTAWDCYPGGHFGYAYIQCSCSAPVITQACSGTSDILTAPPGYAQYTWNPATDLSSINGSPVTLANANSHNTQTYTVTCTPVTGTACNVVVSTIINVSPVIVTTTTDTICPGKTASISATGGGTYQWSNGLGTSNTATPAPTVTTTYTVTVTANGGGCSNSGTVAVVVNSVPVANAGPPVQICPGTPTTLDASIGSSGTPPLSYNWNSPPGTNPLTVSPATTTTYTVTVTSKGGCTSSSSVTVSIVNNLVTNAKPDTTICPNQPVQLQATGGTTFIWAPATALSATTGNSVTASPSVTTTYTVTGTSGTCTASNSVTVTVRNGLALSVSPNDTICPTMSATLTATGASSYTWSGNGIPPPDTGATVIATPAATTIYTVTGTDNGCSGSQTVEVVISNHLPIAVASESICPGGSATLTAVSNAVTYAWSPNTGLSATTGNVVIATPTALTIYSVTGTDNGCTGSTTATVTPYQNPTIIITPPNPSICPGASTTLQANGAATYIWGPGGTLSSTTGTTVTANPTITTQYTVTGTDSHTCTASNFINVNVAPITAHADSTNENCGQANGTATVTAGGNCNQNFTYLWNTTPTQQTGSTAINLSARAYTVTVSCGGCTTTATTTVNNLPGPSVGPGNIYPSKCGYANGDATVIATGVNNPPIIYSWSAGAQTTDSLTNVVSGTYQVTITDMVGCTATNTVTIPNIQGPSVIISGTNPANCGIKNGSATSTVTGGTPGFSFIWDSNPVQNSQILDSVPQGRYCVTVTDTNGCTASICATILPVAGPTASTISMNEICHKANGTATVTATGGLGPGHYIYTWSNGETTPLDTGLTDTTYCVTVSDGGCSASSCVFVGETPGPTAGFMYNPKILTILQGPVYFWDRSIGNIADWQWTFGDNTTGSGHDNVHPYPDTGTYLVTEVVTDSNGCQSVDSNYVRVVDIFTFYIPNAFTPNNDGFNDYFTPRGMNVDPNNYSENIYDRWGNLVFQTSKWDAVKHQAEPWNGTFNNNGSFSNVVMDVYVYKIDVREFNNGPKHEYIGRVTLVP